MFTILIEQTSSWGVTNFYNWQQEKQVCINRYLNDQGPDRSFDDLSIEALAAADSSKSDSESMPKAEAL